MAENQNASFRPKRINFAQISNTALWDDNLSLKAKGLYSLIQSLITIPGMDLRIWKIKAKCKEKSKAFDSAWIELKRNGYLKQYRIPSGARGAFKYEYDLLFEPDLNTSSVINLDKDGNIISPKCTSQEENCAQGPNLDSNLVPNLKDCDHTPHNGGGGQKAEVNPDHTPHNGGGGQEAEINHDHTPRFGPDAKSTQCLMHPVLNGGGNSNTQSGNTFSGNTLVGNTPSVSLPPEETDRSTDETRSKILDQIEYDWIEETHPNDTQAAKALVDYMVEMETLPFTKISRVKQSKYALKKRLDTVSAEDIISFIDHMRGVKPKNIRNINAYWKSAFINYLGEQDLALSTI